MLPHLPWIFLPTGHQYESPSLLGLDDRQHWTDAWAAQQGQARHLLQLAYADRLLGLAIQRLEELDLFDQSLMIVTSDHGCSFKVGTGFRTLRRHNSSMILPVPLLVKKPGQMTPRIDLRNAETVDIVPTILDVLGVPPALWGTHGKSLFDPKGPNRTLGRIFLGIAKHGGKAKILTVDRGRIRRDRPELLRRQEQRLGRGLNDLFDTVPHPALSAYIGTRAKNLSFVGGPERAQWQVVGKKRRSSTSSKTFPIYLQGLVKKPATHPVFLAITVNGIIEGFSRTVEDGPGPLHFQALLRPEFTERTRPRIRVVPLQADWMRTVRTSPSP